MPYLDVANQILFSGIAIDIGNTFHNLVWNCCLDCCVIVPLRYICGKYFIIKLYPDGIYRVTTSQSETFACYQVCVHRGFSGISNTPAPYRKCPCGDVNTVKITAYWPIPSTVTSVPHVAQQVVYSTCCATCETDVTMAHAQGFLCLVGNIKNSVLWIIPYSSQVICYCGVCIPKRYSLI